MEYQREIESQRETEFQRLPCVVVQRTLLLKLAAVNWLIFPPLREHNLSDYFQSMKITVNNILE